MLASQAARKAGVTVKALRYYERLGLVQPVRLGNGYRDYRASDVAVAGEIRRLASLGLKPREAEPFLACLDAGHAAADDCPESLAAYQSKIDELDHLVDRLVASRHALTRRLREAARRGLLTGELHTEELPKPAPLPSNLPVPTDDGAAAHLVGTRLPDVTLTTTEGEQVTLDRVPAARWLLFVYPMTGDPAADIPRGWNEIPGARGCTAEACGFRDNFAALAGLGIDTIFGLSADAPHYQSHLVRRLHLPYPLLSDGGLRLAQRLRLPTFRAGDLTLYKRLTMAIEDGVIRHVFYPVFPPDAHATVVVDWLRSADALRG